MQFSAEEIKKRFGIVSTWTKMTTMENVELFAGNENDPVELAKLDTCFLAMDKFGRKLPYSINISFFGITPMTENGLKDLSHKERMRQQIIQSQVLVFKDFDHYKDYEDSGLNIVFQKVL